MTSIVPLSRTPVQVCQCISDWPLLQSGNTIPGAASSSGFALRVLFFLLTFAPTSAYCQNQTSELLNATSDAVHAVVQQRIEELQAEAGASGIAAERKAVIANELNQLKAKLATLDQASAKQPGTDPKAGLGQGHQIPMFITLGLMAVYLIGGGIWTARVLHSSGTWSLSGALSDNGLPSSSRLIAFLGSQVTLAVLLGTGCYVIWSLFSENKMPSLTPVLAFASGGMTLFAPYVANQIGSALGAAAAPSIATATPNTIPEATAQTVALTGTGFQTGMLASFIDPNGAVAGTAAPIMVNATQANITVTANAGTKGQLCNLVLAGPGGRATTPLRVVQRP